jgi:predicted Ser/Thr protein kinase
LNRFSPTVAQRAPRDVVIIPLRDAKIKRSPSAFRNFLRFLFRQETRNAPPIFASTARSSMIGATFS